MDRLALRQIIDGMNEVQKECRKNLGCDTCFFYTREHPKYVCQITAYVEDNCECVGKNLSLQYAKHLI